MTLMPVSKISVVGCSSSKVGASRWIGQRSSAFDLLALVDHVAEDVEDPAERRVADRNADRRARVLDVHAARKAVGGVHGDRAHAVVAEVLLHLGDQVESGPPLLLRHLDSKCVVDRGEAPVEDGVDDDALDLDDLAVFFSAMNPPVACRVKSNQAIQRRTLLLDEALGGLAGNSVGRRLPACFV